MKITPISAAKSGASETITVYDTAEKSYTYPVKSWGLSADNTLLSFTTDEGASVYWPLSSVHYWTVRK